MKFKDFINERKLYIDDIREPKSSGFDIVRSSKQAKTYMKKHGCPDYISFDHDLGGSDDSMIIVKWMVNRDLDNNGDFIPKNFKFNVHSANPVGAENIRSYLNNYIKQR